MVAIRRGCEFQTNGVGPRARDGERVTEDAESATVILTVVAGLHGPVEGIVAAVRMDIREDFEAIAAVAAEPDAAVELREWQRVGWGRERLGAKDDADVSAECSHGFGVKL